MILNLNLKNSYLNLPKNFYSFVKADNIKNPKIILLNKELLIKLNIDIDNSNEKLLAELLSGQNVKKGNEFFSQAYAGHQFGHFTILGDGRALMLGEHLDKKGQRFDIQLKGSGKTPYSRSGDGKAAIGPMIREYIISEAMYSLGVPTTRSLAVILTGEKILRDKLLPGAILTRVAKSHIRVGTFQFANIIKEKEYIKEITNYTINRHFPELNNKKNNIEKFLEKVVSKQLNLIIQWMRVGFIHGVMNTDNVSIVGETIDYGPCAFMDHYNPKTVFSSIDHAGRYSFENQPKITLWNLARFAETLLFLIDKDEKIAIKKAEIILNKFNENYNSMWLKMMKNKLNLSGENINDPKLINDLLNIMHIHKLDYTNTFLEINNGQIKKNIFLKEWVEEYQSRKKINNKSNDLVFKNINPKIIPRNHIVEKYIKEAEQNKFEDLNKFLNYLKKPYEMNIEIPKELLDPPNEDERVNETFCGT
tara:strand:- start:1877 stop:3307 length:1431 start_codon:yes stop_codon:yes gene_type:complete